MNLAQTIDPDNPPRISPERVAAALVERHSPSAGGFPVFVRTHSQDERLQRIAAAERAARDALPKHELGEDLRAALRHVRLKTGATCFRFGEFRELMPDLSTSAIKIRLRALIRRGVIQAAGQIRRREYRLNDIEERTR